MNEHWSIKPTINSIQSAQIAASHGWNVSIVITLLTIIYIFTQTPELTQEEFIIYSIVYLICIGTLVLIGVGCFYMYRVAPICGLIYIIFDAICLCDEPQISTLAVMVHMGAAFCYITAIRGVFYYHKHKEITPCPA